MILNIEIKAICSDPGAVRQWLEAQGAHYTGLDHQIETYFHTPQGRLKLREGNIEQALIYYNRPETAGLKKSEILLYQAPADPGLKAILSTVLGVKTVVDKERHIYFMDNVKFHVDAVKGLGHFVEIEAIDTDGSRTEQELRDQCLYFQQQLGISDGQLIAASYSDLLLQHDPS